MIHLVAPPRLLLGVLLLAGCADLETSRLEPALATRLERETIRLRAANLTFRYTHDAGTRDAGWEDRRASIVVTDSSVVIHKNAKIGLEITPASRRAYQVSREKDRVRIGAGSGTSRESWSFVPPDSAPAWTDAIRQVIRRSKSVSTDLTS